MTRKPKIGSLGNMTKLHPFLVSKKWHLLVVTVHTYWARVPRSINYVTCFESPLSIQQ